MSDEDFFTDSYYEEPAAEPVAVQEPQQDFSQMQAQYGQLQQTVQSQAQILEGLKSALGGGQAEQPDNVKQYVQDIIRETAQQSGYLTQSQLEVNSSSQELGFITPTAAANYYGAAIDSILASPNASPQERAVAGQILQLWENPQTQGQALKIAGNVFGKAPQWGTQAQQVGQSQTFGHQPGVRQQQTQKPFTSEAEFNEAYYDYQHAKHKQAQSWNARMMKGEEITPY